MNLVSISGNLVADPKTVRESIVTFTVATEHGREVSYIPVTCFDGLAKTVAQYKHKGDGVEVIGHLKQDRWTAQDGKKMSRFHIIGSQVIFTMRAKANAEAQAETQTEAPAENAPAQTTAPVESTATPRKRAKKAKTAISEPPEPPAEF
jgi:single-stranded DNA-binding protein